MTPAIFGLSGPAITPDERAFFTEANPAGYILFGRNVADRHQMRALTDDLRGLHGRDDLPILIDQEGGRVARMKAPVWPEFPPGPRFDALYEISPMAAIEAARTNARAIAHILAEVGVTVDCLPLLDVATPATHAIIGDRALGKEPMRVAAMGRAILDGLRKGGVVGVVKHMPGHGRALVDSHMEMPHVDATAEELEVDIAPFRALNQAPMGMTAHLLYRAWDGENPGTLSPTVVQDIIRGRIGFDGLLMTDDIDMKALSGSAGEKAVRALAAGCDVVLDCWGRMEEMRDIVERCPPMTDAAHARLGRAMATIAEGREEAEFAELVAKRDALLAAA
jgi:beta-N-acetylhexosaminidase